VCEEVKELLHRFGVSALKMVVLVVTRNPGYSELPERHVKDALAINAFVVLLPQTIQVDAESEVEG